MGGSPDIPKESEEQKHLREMQEELLAAQIDLAKNPIPFPKIPKPLPPPPPPTESSADVAAAEEDARRRAALRVNSARGTLFAGETGGYGAAAGGGRTLLG